MDIRAIVESTLVAPMRLQVSQTSLAAACDRIEKLEKVLSEIVHEYDQTYDGEIHGDGTWSAAASIPVDVMERAKAMLK